MWVFYSSESCGTCNCNFEGERRLGNFFRLNSRTAEMNESALWLKLFPLKCIFFLPSIPIFKHIPIKFIPQKSKRFNFSGDDDK